MRDIGRVMLSEGDFHYEVTQDEYNGFVNQMTYAVYIHAGASYSTYSSATVVLEFRCSRADGVTFPEASAIPEYAGHTLLGYSSTNGGPISYDCGGHINIQPGQIGAINGYCVWSA